MKKRKRMLRERELELLAILETLKSLRVENRLNEEALRLAKRRRVDYIG